MLPKKDRRRRHPIRWACQSRKPKRNDCDRSKQHTSCTPWFLPSLFAPISSHTYLSNTSSWRSSARRTALLYKVSARASFERATSSSASSKMQPRAEDAPPFLAKSYGTTVSQMNNQPCHSSRNTSNTLAGYFTPMPNASNGNTTHQIRCCAVALAAGLRALPMSPMCVALKELRTPSLQPRSCRTFSFDELEIWYANNCTG